MRLTGAEALPKKASRIPAAFQPDSSHRKRSLFSGLPRNRRRSGRQLDHPLEEDQILTGRATRL
jgi:hypothetical protein